MRAALPGEDTLLACWQALTLISPGARIVRSDDVVAAVFPNWAPLNNAVLLPGADLRAATAEARSGYLAAGVDEWALWQPRPGGELGEPAGEPGIAGFRWDTSTLVMHTAVPNASRRHRQVVPTSVGVVARLDDISIPVGELEPPDAVPGLTGWAFVHDDEVVAAAWSFRHGHDVGVFALGTVPAWRRRGIAAALTGHILADAASCGARTASLQSTPMGRPLYASLGFAAAGRYVEWVPA